MTKRKDTTERIVPDTSVIISGVLSDLIERGKVKGSIIIPEFVVEELRAQASKGREIGFKGLEEIKKIRELAKKKKGVRLVRTGRRQTLEEIKLARYGRIDALIMDVAKEKKAVMYTSDLVQKEVSEAEGIMTKYFKPYEKEKKLKIRTMLTPDTMSLHLKEGVVPMAKKGKPGDFKLERIGDKPLTPEEIESIYKEIMDAARYEEDAFMEIGMRGANVIQLGDLRIAIARPPFSDSMEITVVRPIIKLRFEDYRISKALYERLAKKAEGVLIAGPPGSGKSTFAASLAEFYESQGKIVKTMESPRDLQVKPEITQYTKLQGDFANTADLLLLVRPDYTVFDEVRKTHEFRIFADMRLAGIGMIGVVHATDPISAIQRFIGRIELGMIPHVIDTILYINAGKIEKVYGLSLTVRTPTGMTESDLARPIVEVKDFETKKLEYEIYTFGEENVIIPVKRSEAEPAVNKLAKKQIYTVVKRFDKNADIEILNGNKAVVRVENKAIPRIIGKKGKTIKELEDHLGISIEVMPKVTTLGEEIDFEYQETGAYIVITFEERMQRRTVNFYVGEDYLFSATVGKNNQVRVAKNSDVGKETLKALLKKNLRAFV